MKYKYYDKPDRLLAESDSPIVFNAARFPVWKGIKPVIEEEKEQEATPAIVVEKKKEQEATPAIVVEKEEKSKRKAFRKKEDN